MKISRRKLVLIGVAVLAGAAGTVPSAAQTTDIGSQPTQVCSNPNRSETLFAERIGEHRIGYGLTPETASIPGPTLQLSEGDCLQVNLVNDTDRRLSMHAHGVAYTTPSDGTPLNDGCVAPGRSRTYVFSAPPPMTRADGTVDAGSAGYWHYHDHCMGTPHGTGGIARGLFGALIIRRAGDPIPDRDPFVVVMGPGSTIGLKRAPRTPTFKADLGERVEFAVIGHGDEFHTFHLHGHRWSDTRTGLTTDVTEQTQILDNRTVGPADSFGFQVVAGEHSGPGAWMYHCHVQSHSDAGMSGLFIVKGPDGQMSKATRRAVRAWQQSHAHHG